MLTQQEQVKFTVINQALKGKITNGKAAVILGISSRQVKRLKKKVRQEGETGAVHGLKGEISNHHLDSSLKQEALIHIREEYTGFKPLFASEKLEERYGIKLNPQTIRRWMIKEGLWKERKQKKVNYRSWRPRKEYFGELQQFDGSYHYWLEDRCCDANGDPLELCLLASIDDATGRITYAIFTKNEGVKAVFQFWLSYIRKHGKPPAIYLDKFSTYKLNHKGAVDNSELMTQFGRAMKDLSILLITANSPQAKGRIERLFQTLQDRLVKELRLAGINTPKEAQVFLNTVFIPAFNKRFSVIPAKAENVHRPLLEAEKQQFNRIFSIQSQRKVNNDFTIQFKNHWYQLTELQPATIRPRETIIVEQWLDGTVHLNKQGQDLNYILLPKRPEKAKTNPPLLTTHPLNWKPPVNHPWRKYAKNNR